MGFGFFGSAVLWLLITFPAYWLFQWTIEGEPFSLWSRKPGKMAQAIGETVEQTIADAGASLTDVVQGNPVEPALDPSAMS